MAEPHPVKTTSSYDTQYIAKTNTSSITKHEIAYYSAVTGSDILRQVQLCLAFFQGPKQPVHGWFFYNTEHTQKENGTQKLKQHK